MTEYLFLCIFYQRIFILTSRHTLGRANTGLNGPSFEILSTDSFVMERKRVYRGIKEHRVSKALMFDMFRPALASLVLRCHRLNVTRSLSGISLRGDCYSTTLKRQGKLRGRKERWQTKITRQRTPLRLFIFLLNKKKKKKKKVDVMTEE